MKKKWTKTTAKLPKEERIIGGDAPRDMVNDRREEFERLFKDVEEGEDQEEDSDRQITQVADREKL